MKDERHASKTAKETLRLEVRMLLLGQVIPHELNGPNTYLDIYIYIKICVGAIQFVWDHLTEQQHANFEAQGLFRSLRRVTLIFHLRGAIPRFVFSGPAGTACPFRHVGGWGHLINMTPARDPKQGICLRLKAKRRCQDLKARIWQPRCGSQDLVASIW